MDLEKRKEIMRSIPWVSEIKTKKPEPCEGLRYGKMPLKAYYGTPDQRAKAQEMYRCKNTAKWRFRALKQRHEYDHVSRSGKYCMKHLYAQGFYGSPKEDDRLQKWLRRHLPEFYPADGE